MSIEFIHEGGTSVGAFGAISDNENGTYTTLFTGLDSGTATTLSAKIDGQNITSVLPVVTVTNTYSLTNSYVSVSSSSVALNSSVNIILYTKDINDNPYVNNNLNINFYNQNGTSNGTFSEIINNENGSYSCTFTATQNGTATNIIASIDGTDIESEHPGVTVINNFSVFNSYITLSSSTVYEGSSVVATLYLRDLINNSYISPSINVVFYQEGGTSVVSFGDVIDNNDGTYTSLLNGVNAGTDTQIKASVQDDTLQSEAPAIIVKTSDAVSLHIEDKADGLGTEINTATYINPYEGIKLFSVSRDTENNFVINENVTWSISDEITGYFNTATGSSSIFYPNIINSVVGFTAEHQTLPNYNTGDININWTNLTASLRFEDSLEDESGHNNDATNNGGTFVNAKVGKGINFTNSNTTYAYIANNETLNLSNSGTISLWFYIDSFWSQGSGLVSKYYSEANNDQAYTLAITSGQILALSVINGSGQINTLVGTTALSTGQWYNVVAGWDANGMHIYLNGILDNSNTTAVTARSTSANLYIGVERQINKNPGHKNYPFVGTLDQVTLWSRTLSNDERAYIYNSGSGR